MGRLHLAAADGAVGLERLENGTGTVRGVAVHGERRAGGCLRLRPAVGRHEIVREQSRSSGRVAGVARCDDGRGDELDIGVDRDVALVPVEAVGAGLVAVAGLGVDRADARSRATRRAIRILRSSPSSRSWPSTVARRVAACLMGAGTGSPSSARSSACPSRARASTSAALAASSSQSAADLPEVR
jgi:hypothetical protein